MQTHENIMARNGLGAQLLRKVKSLAAPGLETLAKARTSARPAVGSPPLNAAKVTAEAVSTAKAVASNAIQQREGMFGPMFAATRAARAQGLAKAAPAHGGVKSAPLDVPKSPMSAPGEEFSNGINVDDPRAVLNAQHRATASAHERLLSDVKAALKPTRNASTGPEAL